MAKKVTKKVTKKRVKKNVERGQAHIQSSFNNTIVTLTDAQGNALSWASAGGLGFRGSRKSTPYAAQMAAETAAKAALVHGLKTVDVFVKGPGSGREAAIRALQACGNKNAKAETESKKAVQDATESTKKAEKTEKIALSDGTYTAEFTTDSSMFHVNDAYDNKGTLTVKDGKATIHVTLTSTHIVNLFLGTAKDASKDKAELLEPTVETVDYGDGTTEEVNAFDIPVPVLDEEFDLALIGTKGKWYDHKVKVSNATPADADASVSESAGKELPDGTYNINLDFEGGSGKASIASPAEVTISGGAATATVQWSSPNYDYMIVDGQKYMPVNTDGNSVFEIPVKLDTPMQVIGDTVAMSKPHEIEYTLTFHSDSATEVLGEDGE